MLTDRNKYLVYKNVNFNRYYMDGKGGFTKFPEFAKKYSSNVAMKHVDKNPSELMLTQVKED